MQFSPFCSYLFAFCHVRFSLHVSTHSVDWVRGIMLLGCPPICTCINFRKSVHIFAPPQIGKQSILTSMSVYVYICLSTIISLKLQVWSSPIFLCLLTMAVALSSSGGTVICYKLLVLWMTSYLLIGHGCSTLPPSWSAVHTQLWAWL